MIRVKDRPKPQVGVNGRVDRSMEQYTQDLLSRLREKENQYIPTEDVYRLQYGSDWPKVREAVTQRNPQFSKFLRTSTSVTTRDPRTYQPFTGKGEYVESSGDILINRDLDSNDSALLSEVLPHEVRHKSQFEANPIKSPLWQKAPLDRWESEKLRYSVPSFSGSSHNYTELFSYGMGVLDKANALRASQGQSRFLPSVSDDPVNEIISGMRYYVNTLDKSKDPKSRIEKNRAQKILSAYEEGKKIPEVRQRMYEMLQKWAEIPQVSVKDGRYEVT